MTAEHERDDRCVDRIVIGPLIVDVATPKPDPVLRSHFAGVVSRSADSPAGLRIDLGSLDAVSRAPHRLRTARGEVRLGIDLQRPAISGALALTVRAVLRAAKRGLQREFFLYGRRRLLLRHALEHPLMTSLDLDHGFFTIHASAVERNGHALLILGANGSGKTTTARRLVAEHGFRWVADNFSPSDGATVLTFPGEPRLSPVTAVPAPACAVPRAPEARIAAVVLLDDGGRSGSLGQDDALETLRRYVAAEREDHRDTALFASVRTLRGGKSSEADVVARLSGLPFHVYDWRTAPLTELPLP